MNVFHFDFTVDGLTQEQASALLELIIRFAESHGAEVGGGFGPEGQGNGQSEGNAGGDQEP